MRLVGLLAVACVVGCSVTVRAESDAEAGVDAGDASADAKEAAAPGCTGAELAERCLALSPAYTRGFAPTCEVDAGYPCHNFNDGVICCP